MAAETPIPRLAPQLWWDVALSASATTTSTKTTPATGPQRFMVSAYLGRPFCG